MLPDYISDRIGALGAESRGDGMCLEKQGIESPADVSLIWRLVDLTMESGMVKMKRVR